jgi:DNA-binding response OmpR family regulator
VESDGVDGLRASTERDYYDVAVLDIMLPGPSAYSPCVQESTD